MSPRLFVLCIAFAASLPADLSAMPRAIGEIAARPEFLAAQYTSRQGRDFRRCMRNAYGPRYFSGVKRAHRTFMAQACGG